LRRTVITGAGGWVGRVAASEGDEADLVLIARTPRQMKLGAVNHHLHAPDALLELDPGSRPRIVHAGFPTQDQVERMGESAYKDDVAALRLAIGTALERLGPVDFVYLSSGAATSVERGSAVAPRTAAYGKAKLDDEHMLTELIHRLGGRLCIVRAFALSGPYMTKPETYALGNMILQASRHGSIEVRAPQPVRRSYMSIADMLRVAMHAVEQIPAGGSITFETAGEVVEMGELASRVLAVMGCDPGSVVRHELDPDAPADDYLGDPDVVGHLAAAAGVVPTALDDQIAVTAEWLCAEYGL
jgi:nucleoside-diphosphate-sugar epimerase